MLKDIISLKNKVELININKNNIIRKMSLFKNYILKVKPMMNDNKFILNPSDILSMIFMVTSTIKHKNHSISVRGQSFLIVTLPDKTIELEIVDKDLINLNIISGDNFYKTDIVTNNINNNNKPYIDKINEINSLLKNQLNDIVIDYFFR